MTVNHRENCSCRIFRRRIGSYKNVNEITRIYDYDVRSKSYQNSGHLFKGGRGHEAQSPSLGGPLYGRWLGVSATGRRLAAASTRSLKAAHPPCYNLQQQRPCMACRLLKPLTEALSSVISAPNDHQFRPRAAARPR